MSTHFLSKQFICFVEMSKSYFARFIFVFTFFFLNVNVRIFSFILALISHVINVIAYEIMNVFVEIHPNRKHGDSALIQHQKIIKFHQKTTISCNIVQSKYQ